MPVPVVNLKETDVEKEDSKFKKLRGKTSLSVAFHDDSINNLILKLNNHEDAHSYSFSWVGLSEFDMHVIDYGHENRGTRKVRTA